MPHVAASLLLAAAVLAPPVPLPKGAAEFLEGSPSPDEYVLGALERRRIVILGEAHWIAHEAALVKELVPALAKRGIPLAIEMLPASEQARLDAILTAESWDEAAAIAILRAADWPYRDYLEIVRAAWEVNRKGSDPKARLLALAPPPDWRDTLLPQGKDYESFMADRVAAALPTLQSRILVYCGLHHGFTRFEQPEVRDDGFTHRFMDRMGNLLRRRFGEDAFLIMFHRPVWCGDPKDWSYCLPFEGALDCAADAAGGKPHGFDVAGSPFASLTFDRSIYYAHGVATLRFDEFVDGYLWSQPLEAFAGVGLIPLDAYAPDAAALAQVIASNTRPGRPGPTREDLEARWKAEGGRLADAVQSRRWGALAQGWRARCGPEKQAP
jgi:hypothetical protein